MTHELANKAVRNIFFSAVRLIVSTGATVCTSAIIARTLGPGDMGFYSYTTWLVGAVAVLATIGLPAALTKYISEYIGRGEIEIAAHLCKRLLLTQLAAAVLASAVSGGLLFLKPSYRNMILVVAAMVFLQAIQQALSAALAGIQRFDKIALISFYTGLTQVASVGIAAFLHSGVLGMLWATLAGIAAGSGLCYRALERPLLQLDSPRPLADAPDIYRRVRTFSITISYVLLLDLIVWQRSEVLFLKWRSTLAQIAFYTLAYNIATKLNELGSTFSSTLLPIYSESFGRDGMHGIGTLYVRALKYLQMLMVPLCFLGAAISKPLVQFLYGQEYLPLVQPLQLLLLTSGFTSIGVVGSPLLVGTEKQTFIAKLGTVIAILNVALDIVLIPQHGAIGAAIANCTAQALGVLGGTFYIIYHFQIRFPWKTTATIYFAAIVAIAPAAYFENIVRGVAVVGLVIVGSIIYLLLLAVVGELDKRDLDLLWGAFLGKVRSSKMLQNNCLAGSLSN